MQELGRPLHESPPSGDPQPHIEYDAANRRMAVLNDQLLPCRLSRGVIISVNEGNNLDGCPLN